MTRILATGDRQIGVHPQYGHAPGVRLAEQELVGERIIDLALDRGVDLILDGGDVFEGSEVNDEHREAFIRPLERLDGKVPYLVALGNGRHDRSTKPANALQTLRHVPGLIAASRPDVYEFPGCVVGVLPNVAASRLRAKSNGGDPDEINAIMADALLDIARGLHTDCKHIAPELPAVLLAHWSVSGASLPTGLPADAMREPVLDLSEVEQLGFDAVVLAHIHKHQVLCEDPWIGYVGSPMPHDFSEAGYEHGVVILELST